MRHLRLSADHVLTLVGPPLAGGAVLVGPDGRIAAVGEDAAVPRPLDAAAEHLPGVLLPGLINTHTHLELTGLAHQAPPEEFARWIRELRAAKAERSEAAVGAAARQGVRDAFAAGITTVADTGDSGAVLPALVEAGGSGIVYQEVFGPHPEQSAASLEELRRRLEALRARAAGRVRVGVSPHAPYTVSAPLYRAVARVAREEDLPLAVHLAESADETALVVRGEGAFAAAWRERGIPPLAQQGRDLPEQARRSPVAWLDALGVLGPGTLCIHCVRADPDDIRILRARGAAVAHCPVSNRRHGHGAAPLTALRSAGVPVGVGTDSVVSVGRIDLPAELRAARALAGLSWAEALELATTEAARALGLADTGRLAPGAWADLVAFDAVPGLSPEAAVVEAGPAAVVATWVGGREVYRRPPA